MDWSVVVHILLYNRAMSVAEDLGLKGLGIWKLSIGVRWSVPVNSSHVCVLTEGRVMLVGLLPELLAALGVVGRVDGVIDADDDNQGPGEGYEDPVRVQRVGIMRLTTGEGVVNRHGLRRA